MDTSQPDFVTPATQHFADFPAEPQMDNSTLSTQARGPSLLKSADTDEHNILTQKIETGQTKEPSVDNKQEGVPLLKYNKLKRRFSDLRQEYLQTITDWEHSAKQLESLTHERKFLRKKLQYFLASKQNVPQISDEELTAILLQQTAQQSARLVTGQMRPASQTQISIGKQNGLQRHSSNLNGVYGYELNDFENGIHQDSAAVNQRALRLKALYDEKLKGIPESEHEKYMEEIRISHKRSTAPESFKQSWKQAHGNEEINGQLIAQSAVIEQHEQSSKIKISFAQMNGGSAAVKSNKQSLKGISNSQAGVQQVKQPKHQQLPLLPPASLVIAPSQAQLQSANNQSANQSVDMRSQQSQLLGQKQQRPATAQ